MGFFWKKSDKSKQCESKENLQEDNKKGEQ